MKPFLRSSLSALLLFLASFSVQAQTTNIWTGTTDTDWHTTGNWSLTLVPEATHNVLIPGGLTNYPVLSSAASASAVEVRSGASLTITSTGSLTVNGSKPVGIGGFFYIMGFYNGGTVVNSGSLSVGTSAAVGQVALWNASSFTNMATGNITLDNSSQEGLYTGTGSSFVNGGSIRIGTSASVGFSALWNVSSFTNTATGNITLDNSRSQGLLNSGSFVNSGSVTAGSNAAVGAHALRNLSSFTNTATGTITLDNGRDGGLFNHSGGSFVNSATLTFGTSLTRAIQNDGMFDNQGGGCANPAPGFINSLGDGVITNTSSFSNTGTIIERSTGNSNISFNGGVIQNLNGGSFTVASGSTELTWTGNTSTDWNTATNWCPTNVPTASSNVLIPSGPANQPIISTTAVAHTVEVTSGASLTITSAGSLSVNGSKFGMSVTARFRNQGTVVNDGQVFLGNSPSATPTLIGLRNVGMFTQNAGALMTIDRASYGLYNLTASGSFVNSATLAIGSVGSNGLYALFNADGASFSNTTGGYITLDRATDRALFNDGASSSFVNSATIVIGSIAEVVWQGVWNNGSFRNLAGGFIAIDRTTNVGLVNTNSETGFINSGTITIGASATIGSDGISNIFGGSFTNTAGGSITIDRTYGSGVYNGVPYLGIECRFLNAATITIGTSLTSAIQNDGSFDNQGGGCANPAPGLINSLGNGIITNNSSFSNTGTIIERSTGNSNISFNGGVIQNLNGGSFTVASGSTELTWTGNTSTDWNTATNWCPSMVPIASSNVMIPSGPANQPIISTTAVAHTVEVQSGASLTISSAGSLSVNGSKFGLNGNVRFRNGGTVVNDGQVFLGNSPSATAAHIGLRNAGTFTQNTGARMTIDWASQYGLLNTMTGSSFVNSGTLAIGAVSSVGLYALANLEGATFSNTAGGYITLDRATGRALWNALESSSFTNSATLVIGGIADVGTDGIDNVGSFSNTVGGFIAIDRAGEGLSNSSGASFINSGTITIGASATIGSRGLVNGGSFSNTAGGSITIDRARLEGLLNASSFVNSATIIFGTNLTKAIQNNSRFDNQGGGCANPAPGFINSLGNGVIINASSFSNTGTIIESSTGNSGISFNGGVIQNLNGGSFTVATPSFTTTLTVGPSGTLTCAQTSLTLTATGGANYNFEGPGLSQSGSMATAVVSQSGVFSVTATDATGCTSTTSTTISSNTTAPTLSLASSNSLNCSTTSATLSATAGGFGSLTYTFTGGALPGSPSINSTVTVNQGGSYSVLVTAENGCTALHSTSVASDGALPSVTLSANGGGTLTCAQTSLTLSATGGTSYTFTGSGLLNQSSSGSAVVNQAGTFTVTAAGSNGCTATQTTTVFSNTTAPTVSVSATSGTLTCAVTSITLTATSSSTGLLWSNAATTQSITVNSIGTYSVTATGGAGHPGNGCSAVSNTVTIGSNTNAPTGAMLTASNSGTLTCSVQTLTLTASAGSGLPAGSSLSYVFTGPSGSLASSGNTLPVSESGLYSVTITGANGCTTSANTTVFSNTVTPTVNINPTSGTLTCTVTSLTLTATTSGTGVRWNTNELTTSIVVSTSGTYSVTATASNGCFNTSSVTINSEVAGSSSAPTLSASSSVVCAGVNVQVVSTVPGSPSGLQWYKDGQIVTGQTSATLSLAGVQAAQAGSYVLVVAGVCSVTSSAFTLTVNPLPTVLLTFPVGSTVVGPGTGVATITLPDPLPAGFDLSFGVFGGVSFSRVIVLDRINGFEIRQVDSNRTGRFSITRPGPFTITATDGNGCKQMVQGVITNLPAVIR